MLIPLDKNKILSALPSALKDQRIQLVVEQSVDSTNTYLKNQKTNHPVAICIAEQQIQGRGRLNRPWQSPFGENIYCSFKLSYKDDLAKLPGLSLAISVALHKVLNTHLKNSQLKIKWPNDLLFSGKKLAGILIELCNQRPAQRNPACVDIIIGIGININMTVDPENKITQAWTSLKECLNKVIDRNIIISDLINEVIVTWKQFLKSGLSDFTAYYHQHDFLKNKTLKVEVATNIYEGQAMGINDRGLLRLKLPDGKILELHSGEAKISK